MKAFETHDGKVRIEFEHGEQVVTRDEALLFAVELVVASSTLSAEEIVKCFKQETKNRRKDKDTD